MKKPAKDKITIVKRIKKPADKKPAVKKPTFEITWKLVGWTLAMLAWVAFVLIGSQLLVGGIMLSILGKETFVQPVWTATYSAIAFILCLILAILVPWKLLKIKTNRDELGLTGLPTWTDIGLAPVGYIVSYLGAMLVAVLSMSIIPGIDWEQTQNVGFQNLFSTGDKLLAFAAIVIFAPIAEEIIFRGWLYGKLRGKLPAWVSILLVSILFGALHMQWNVAINVACLSVVMCLLREVTGTIWSSILLHMLKNGIAFYFLFINPILS